MKRISLATALLGLAAHLPADAAAGVSSPVDVATRPSAHCLAPRWAPDGMALAYEIFHPKKDLRETWLVRFTRDGAPTGEPKMVTTNEGTGLSGRLGGKPPPVVDFAWAPNMKLLSEPYVFSSRGPKKNFDLFADGDWLTPDLPGNDGQPAWSPDGTKIAFTSQQKDSGDIMLLDLASSKTSNITFWTNATEYGASWDSSGKRLLFTRAMAGNKGQDIAIIDDASRPKESTRLITEWPGDEIRPTFSPDGNWVGFYSNKDNRNDKVFDLWVVGTDGQHQRKLATDVVVGDYGGPAWTPDSTTLLHVGQDFQQDNPVRWVRRDGSQAGTLATDTQLNGDLAIYHSAAGQMRLAFKALGRRGSDDKTWQRLYMVTFSMADLIPDPIDATP